MWDEDYSTIWDEDDNQVILEHPPEGYIYQLPNTLIDNFLFYIGKVYNGNLNRIHPDLIGKWVAIFDNTIIELQDCNSEEASFKIANEHMFPMGTLMLLYGETDNVLHNNLVHTTCIDDNMKEFSNINWKIPESPVQQLSDLRKKTSSSTNKYIVSIDGTVQSMCFDTGASSCVMYSRECINLDLVPYFTCVTSGTASGSEKYLNFELEACMSGLKFRKAKFGMPFDFTMIHEILKRNKTQTVQVNDSCRDLLTYLMSEELNDWTSKVEYEEPKQEIKDALAKFGVITAPLNNGGLIGMSYLKHIIFLHRPDELIQCFDDYNDLY